MQLEMSMELENEIECLQIFRYSNDKDADFILRINAALRIVGIMKIYFPEPLVKLHTDTNFLNYIKQNMFPHEYKYAPFEFIYKVTTTWAQG